LCFYLWLNRPFFSFDRFLLFYDFRLANEYRREAKLFFITKFAGFSFEFTVLCAAHGMAVTYFIRNGIFPGIKAKNPDPRTTDDKFLMEIHNSDNKKVSEQDILDMINKSGVYELNIKEVA